METHYRELHDHKINPANERLVVAAHDAPGEGGASHNYSLTIPSEGMYAPAVFHLRFQNGPISTQGGGLNGITQEALLAIVADRLRGFQSGPYACRDNAVALTHVETAQLWLQKRTLERMRRGVEGTHHV